MLLLMIFAYILGQLSAWAEGMHVMNIAGMADGCVYDGQQKYTINFVTLVGHDNWF